MAIGAIWGEIWNEAIWNTAIWSQDAVEPTPEPEATQKPAGRKRRRYVVEIDGQEFEVSSPSEALSLLERAKQTAEAIIEKARSAPVRVSSGVQRPRITTKAPELRKVVAQARKQIVSLYDGLERDLEIAALMARRIEEEDEEETIIRLLM